MAPENEGKCKYRQSCKETGTFAVRADDDRGNTLFYIDPICDKHILAAFQDALFDEEVINAI